eukprot:GILJ01014215.1.p1 GENE.GILJ01014215.1~~GILJ01014215.1.p1  ORF type:complete len:147 (-),score=7.08 GILJ01014215.1:106-546(-)
MVATQHYLRHDVMSGFLKSLLVDQHGEHTSAEYSRDCACSQTIMDDTETDLQTASPPFTESLADQDVPVSPVGETRIDATDPTIEYPDSNFEDEDSFFHQSETHSSSRTRKPWQVHDLGQSIVSSLEAQPDPMYVDHKERAPRQRS